MANLYKIKDLAAERKMSLKALADIVGISENQIHVMCRTNSTKIDTLEKIAQTLKVPISVFFDESVPSVHTEGDYSPASGSGNVTVSMGDAVLAERIKYLEALIAEKNERIAELKDRIEELKAR